jgi:hypothetical protein
MGAGLVPVAIGIHASVTTPLAIIVLDSVMSNYISLVFRLKGAARTFVVAYPIRLSNQTLTFTPLPARSQLLPGRLQN